MKSNLLCSFGLVLTLLASCSKEEVLPETDAVEISTQIIPLTSSRVHISREGITPESGTASTHELTYTNAGWTPQLTWNGIQTDKASFVAVYPNLNRTESEETVHEVVADQRKDETYQALDLLAAQATAQRGEWVNLDFYHKMNCVVVYLSSKNEAFTAQELASATVTIKVYRQIAFHPHSAELGTAMVD